MAKFAGWDFRSHGLTAGTSTTTSNISSFALYGGALTVATGNGGTVTAQSTDRVQFVDGSSTAYAYINTPAPSGDIVSGVIYVPSAPAAPAAEYRVIQGRNAADNGDAWRLIYSATRQWSLQNGSGATVVGPLTAVTQGAAHRVEFAINLANGASSAGYAWIGQFTTNPTTSTTPDSQATNSTVTWPATDLGPIRAGAPHSAGTLTISTTYASFENASTSPHGPLALSLGGGAGGTDVSAYKITNDITGGNGGPYTITAVSAPVSGPGIGTISFSGLTFWGTSVASEDSTYDVTISDGAGTTKVVRHTVTAPPTGGGAFMWDTSLNGGSGGFAAI